MTREEILSAIAEGYQKLAFIHKDTLSVSEASDFSTYSEGTIYKMIEKGTISSFNPDGGRVFVDKKELEGAMRRNKRSSRADLKIAASNHKFKRSA